MGHVRYDKQGTENGGVNVLWQIQARMNFRIV